MPGKGTVRTAPEGLNRDTLSIAHCPTTAKKRPLQWLESGSVLRGGVQHAQRHGADRI